MAKRRRRRRLIKLTRLQEICLIFGSHRAAFDSELQTRAAWFRHRDSILKEFIYSHPGMRPWAFWRFEWRGPERTGRDDWTLLSEAGEIGEEEKALVLAQWLQLLELKRGYLQSVYEHYRQGWAPPHGPDWPDLCRQYEAQSLLLGEMAAKTWAAIKGEVATAWGRDGCGGCAVGFIRCSQKGCKHYQKNKQTEAKEK